MPQADAAEFCLFPVFPRTPLALSLLLMEFPCPFLFRHQTSEYSPPLHAPTTMYREHGDNGQWGGKVGMKEIGSRHWRKVLTCCPLSSTLNPNHRPELLLTPFLEWVSLVTPATSERLLEPEGPTSKSFHLLNALHPSIHACWNLH